MHGRDGEGGEGEGLRGGCAVGGGRICGRVRACVGVFGLGRLVVLTSTGARGSGLRRGLETIWSGSR